MKKILLLTILTLIFGLSTFAQTVERQIAAIRAEVAAINRAGAKYTKKTRNVEDVSLEGTEATYYVSGKGLKKIVAKMYGETYNATGEYYYSGEELIFAFVRFNRYDTQIGVTPVPKVVRSEEQRFYFSGGNLIRLLVGKKQLKPGAEKYEELKTEALAISGKLKEAY